MSRARVAGLAGLVCIGVSALATSASGQAATVSTMAELRSAIANNTITAININPGTYVLTSSGSGQLQIERALTITNTGGGRVVLDANGASRVFSLNSATVTMTGLTITGGDGNGGSEGGAIFANSCTFRLIQSTVSGSATSGAKPGGAIWSNGCTFELTNSTVSGNTAGGSQGGGVAVNGGTALVNNSTVAGNSASTGGGVYRNGAELTLRNSILADNTGGQVGGNGTITSNGKNLVEGGCTGCPAGDLTADPKLGPLGNNGGNSYTHALLAGSPALNAASNADAQPTDQRGVTRPQGPTADIGAFESAAAAVGVTPDGGQNVQQLPSNGATYTFTFTVQNTGGATESFDLLASSPGSAVITIVSVNGAAGDSTRLTGLAAGASQAVGVVYSVAGAPAGSRDTLQLRARSVTQPTVTDDGTADLTVIRPSLTITKQAFRDDQVTPVGVGTVTPGEYLQYKVTVTNAGSAPAAIVDVKDSVPAQETFIAAGGDAAGWTFSNTGNQVDADLAGTLAVGASRFFWVRVRVN